MSYQMQESLEELADAVIGHKIVSAEDSNGTVVLSLDDGSRVMIDDTWDCCAYTSVENFLLDPKSIEHVITSVTAKDNFAEWVIMADMGGVMKLDVAWDEGSGYYMVGLRIQVKN